MRLRPSDNAEVQMARIEKVARSLAPNSNVLFDDNAPHGFIRFRIETQSGTALAESDIIHATAIAEWSDEELRQCIRTLAAEKI
jgi:UDP-N-acetylenolpyruvoylglucosamine reductase